MSGGRSKKTLLVDALEAIIAAIYLDGGVEAARDFVAAHVLDGHGFERRQARTFSPRSRISKTRCASWRSRASCRSRAMRVRERGPEHAKIFTVEVRVGKDWSGQAEGRTKKMASQRAAAGVYERCWKTIRRDAERKSGRRCADQREITITVLSAFICVHPRPRVPRESGVAVSGDERLHESGGVRQYPQVAKRISGGIAGCARSCSACWSRTWPGGGSSARWRPAAAPGTSRTCCSASAAGPSSRWT